MNYRLNNTMKKIITQSTFVLLLYNFHSVVYAGGGMDGGGGRSVVCREKNGKIKEAELFDFYEGKIQYKVTPKISKEPFEIQVEKMIQNLGQGRGVEFTETLRIYAQFIIENMQILPDGTGLLPVEDSKHVISPPKGCQYEQLANYTNQNQVLVNGEIWNFWIKNNTNKAGLVVHEAVYKVFRDYGATDSLRARKVVALTFSGVIPFLSIAKGLPEKPLKCQTLSNEDGSPFPGSSFYAYNNTEGELILQFDSIDGQLMLSNTMITLDKIPKELLLSENETEIPLSNYWMVIGSLYDRLTPLAISFQPKDSNKEHRKIMKIGIRNMPNAPSQEFVCGQSE